MDVMGGLLAVVRVDFVVGCSGSGANLGDGMNENESGPSSELSSWPDATPLDRR